jgi:hypothetical protein
MHLIALFDNHAQVIGAQAGDDRFGKKNQAYETGQGKSLVAANSPQQNSANTTIELLDQAQLHSRAPVRYMFSPTAAGRSQLEDFFPSHGKPVFTTHPGFCCSDMDSGTPLTVGAWTHVAMVHDGSKTLSISTAPESMKRTSAAHSMPLRNLLGIGFDPIDNNYFFDGSLDEVQIYRCCTLRRRNRSADAEQSTPVAGGDITAPSSPLNLSADVLYTNVTSLLAGLHRQHRCNRLQRISERCQDCYHRCNVTCSDRVATAYYLQFRCKRS